MKSFHIFAIGHTTITKIRWLLLDRIKMMMKHIYKQQDLFCKLSEDQKHNQREYIRVMASCHADVLLGWLDENNETNYESLEIGDEKIRSDMKQLIM